MLKLGELANVGVHLVDSYHAVRSLVEGAAEGGDGPPLDEDAARDGRENPGRLALPGGLGAE